MSTGPLLNLFEAARRSPVALGLIAVALLQEGLVLALEVVLEHHALDAGALTVQAIGVLSIERGGRVVLSANTRYPMNDHWKSVCPRVAERAKLAAYGKEQRHEPPAKEGLQVSRVDGHRIRSPFLSPRVLRWSSPGTGASYCARIGPSSVKETYE
jgi:hypothetical protein